MNLENIKEKLDLTEFIATFRPKINVILAEILNKQDIPEQLKVAMLYSLNAGGKRVRPLLTLAVVASFGKKITAKVLRLACIVELVHTYSLIHDDLPAMDNDDLRRGKPTNHKVYGEATAILAGDALLTHAFQLITEEEIPTDLKINLVKHLAKAAGSSGLVAGQILDLLGSQKKISFEQLQEIHLRKTGALLQYCVLAGFFLAAATDEKLLNNISVKESLLNFAQSFGLAFQIRDDCLDVTCTSAELGKTAGKDIIQEKSTYPQMFGLEKSEIYLQKEIEKAAQICDNLAKNTKDFSSNLLKEFAEMLKIEV